MANPVTVFNGLGQDRDRLVHFYTAAFGWNVAEESVLGYRLVDTASANGTPGCVGKARNSTGCVTFYVGVPDPAATLAQIERLGGKTVMPATRTATGFTLGYFSDPEGHVVGLMKA